MFELFVKNLLIIAERETFRGQNDILFSVTNIVCSNWRVGKNIIVLNNCEVRIYAAPREFLVENYAIVLDWSVTSKVMLLGNVKRSVRCQWYTTGPKTLP